MCKGEKFFVCDLPYTVAVAHGLLTQDRVDAIRKEEDMSEISWQMEMCGIFYGENENAFFKSQEINPCRTLSKPFYPLNNIDYLKNRDKKVRPQMPKQPGEIRILGADIALSAGAKNDNSIYTLMRLLPNGEEFERQVVYMESHNGVNSETQSIYLKRLFYDFQCDNMIIDSQGIGISVFQELQKIQYDNDRDVEYPAFTSFNEDKTVDKELARRNKALPVIYSLKVTSLSQNHDIAMGLKDAFLKRKIRLMINDAEAKDALIEKGNFLKKSPLEQAELLKPYVQTTATINEIINLECTITNGFVKVHEKGSRRKDRYSSLSYTNYLANILEKQELKKRSKSQSKVMILW